MNTTISIETRNNIVLNHMYIARAIAHQYRHTHLEPADLIQEGAIGLILAAERFDPSRNIRFESYAAWWVRKYITEAIRRYGYIITLPQHRPDEHVYTEPLDRVVDSDNGELLTYEDILRSHDTQPDKALEMKEALEAFIIAKNHAKKQKKRFDVGKWHQKYVNK